MKPATLSARGLDEAAIDRLRAETTGIAHRIHLNNAGSSLPPDPVVARQVAFLQREAEIGGYEAAEEAQVELAAVYDKTAKLLNARREEIALVENATVGWQMIFYALRFQPGDRILTSQAEYGANYVAFLHRAKELKLSVEVIPSGETGETSPEALAGMIDERVKLVAITHVPTNGGLVNRAADLGAVARAHKIPYLLDACQSAGQMPLDVAELACDFLSASARKYLRGPRGSGFLYVRQNWLAHLHPAMIDHYSAKWLTPERYELRKDAGRFENWENNYAARAGLGAAIDYAQAIGLEAIWQRIQQLAAHLRAGLAALPGVRVHDTGKVQCGIVSFAVAGLETAHIKAELAQKGINVSISTPDSTLIDSTRRALPPMIRASVHYFNITSELDRLVNCLGEMIERQSASGK